MQIYDTFKWWGQILPKSCYCRNNRSVFLSNFASIFMVLRHNSSVLFYRKVYILSTKGACQSTNLVKLYISSPRPEIMHFDGILLSKSGTFSAKKAQRIISHETEEGYKF